MTKDLEGAGADVIDLASDDSAEGAPLGMRRSCEPKRLLRLPAMPPQAQPRCATSFSGCASSLSECASQAVCSLPVAPNALTCVMGWALRCALMSDDEGPQQAGHMGHIVPDRLHACMAGVL